MEQQQEIIINEKAPSIRATCNIPINHCATAKFHTFNNLRNDKAEHFAIEVGKPGAIPLVRMHSECITGDLFGSRYCDCGK